MKQGAQWLALRPLFIAGYCLALAVAPVSAEQKKPKAVEIPVKLPAVLPPQPPPPYEQELFQLAEALGALSYLNTICPDETSVAAAAWRDKAQALIDAEAASGPTRERLMGLFNRGFITFTYTHRECNPNTRASLRLLLTQGADLAQRISARYGG